jgi:hypothetical protein
MRSVKSHHAASVALLVADRQEARTLRADKSARTLVSFPDVIIATVRPVGLRPEPLAARARRRT